MKKVIAVIGVAALLATVTHAQTVNTNGIFGPVLSEALSLLPAWDPTATNDFASGEIEFGTAPLWKTATAAGTTPYNSTSLGYFFTRNVGLGGELVSFGDGAGNNAVDTMNGFLKLRKPLGNIAPYALFSGGYGLNTHKAIGGFGPGIDYQSTKLFRIFVDTRFSMQGTSSDDRGWLTRVGVSLAF